MKPQTTTERAPTPSIADHIVSTPGTCGGKPRIAGHRITVQNVGIWHVDGGMAAAEIASTYGLSLAEVHAALAYYYDHTEEIRATIRADEEFAESLRSKSLSILKERLRQRNAQHRPVSG